MAQGSEYSWDDSYPSGDPSAPGPPARDPYAVGPDGSDPYAVDPLTADGFAPVFSTQGASAPISHVPYASGPSYPGRPTYAGPYAPPPPTSGVAITGFILGLAALLICGGLTSPVGLIFSAMGLRETGPMAAQPRSGRGFAIAGLVTNILGLGLLLLSLLYVGVVIVAVLVETSV